MASRLYLKQIELGPMQNFVYLIGDQASRECVVVDPAWDPDFHSADFFLLLPLSKLDGRYARHYLKEARTT